MIGILFWFKFVFLIKENAATFFHEPSYVVLSSPENKADFGYSMIYSPNENKLVVGAPSADSNGKVYSCPINDGVLTEKKMVCDNIPINIDEQVPSHSRRESPNQNYCLGASVAVTPSYIFSCAPLLTKHLVTDDKKVEFGAYGTCFVTNSTHTRPYFGRAEQFEKKIKVDINDFYGGVGWTTLSDDENKIILISKLIPASTIHLMDMEQPLNPTKVVKISNFGYIYQGRAFAYGVFFKGHKKLYAFSAESFHRIGVVAFLTYDETSKKMELLMERSRNKAVLIQDNKIGSLFGASLHEADLNCDNYTELLVGAPVQTYNEHAFENGAIHIYLGGKIAKRIDRSTVCICSTKDAARFGSAIATTDLDEDGFPEIFVSAPYEDSGKGAVYIFSGYVVNQLLKNNHKSCVFVSNVVNTQKIQNDELQTLGFSLQALPVPKFDEYGEYMLAMSSPLSGKVALYRSVPSITVNVSAVLKGAEVVRERDNNFTVSVTLTITYPSKSESLSGKLLVKTSVSGEMAWIESGEYEIMLSERKIEYVNDIVVSLGNNDPGRYTLTARVESNMKETFKNKDFTSELVNIRPQSTLLTHLDVIRKCIGDECMPDLSLKFEWSGSNGENYLLGSTESETMTVIVRNDGNTTFGSCARIKVTGAQIALIKCEKESEDWYKCNLPNIERHKNFSISIDFDMSTPTNKDTSLSMNVLLYNTCTSKANGAPETKEIAYSYNTDDIIVRSKHFNRNITDREIKNVDSDPDIEINELYTITNKGSVLWILKEVVIILEMQPFIKDYLIPANLGICKKEILEKYISYKCSIELLPRSDLKIRTTVTIAKEKILKNLKNGTLQISSNFTIFMEPTSGKRENSTLTQLGYQEDISFGENITLIIIIVVVVACFVLAVLVFILYKVGFFKRKEKNDLDELRRSIRKKDNPQATATKIDNPESQQNDEDLSIKSNISVEC